MNKLVTATVVGGAVLAVGVLPAAGLASATGMPTPIPVPVSPTATTTPGMPTPPPAGSSHHHKIHHKHKPTNRRHPVVRQPVVHLSVVGQPVLPATTTSPRPPSTQALSHIVGGQDASDAPWAVQVSWDDTGFECSGTAIAPQWVLTAGHCADPDGMSVLIGSLQLGQGTQDKVDNAVVDPNGDMALLHLADPVQTTFASLADQDPKAGDVNEIYGWGKTDPTSGPSPQLKMAEVKVTSVHCHDGADGPAICNKAVTGTAFNGDSGGPEMADGVEVGVCSTGDEQARTQEYASIAANRDWIKQVAAV